MTVTFRTVSLSGYEWLTTKKFPDETSPDVVQYEYERWEQRMCPFGNCEGGWWEADPGESYEAEEDREND